MRVRKKPVVVDAFLYTGKNFAELCLWITTFNTPSTVCYEGGNVFVQTLEGKMELVQGAYLMRGIKGEMYPCAADIFEATYDILEEVPA